MKKQISKLWILMMFLIIISFMELTFVSAQIESLSTSKINTNIQLVQSVTNSTYCNLTKIQYPNNTILSLNSAMTRNGNDYNYTFSPDALGEYSYITCCNPNSIETCVGVTFEVTTTGNNVSLIIIVFYIAGLCVLFAFLIGCIYSFVKFDNLLNRVGMLGFSYLILIAISFIVYQMCLDFLSRSSFITDMIWWIWVVLMYASIIIFPLGFIWYMYNISQIKEIQQLIDKGFSEDEAEHRIKGRRKH